jgi:hypothetical protein
MEFERIRHFYKIIDKMSDIWYNNKSEDLWEK